MPYNIDKCRVIHYGNTNVHHWYFIDDKNVLNTNSIKDLSITFDNKLEFDQHINNNTTSANSRIGITIIGNKFNITSCLDFELDIDLLSLILLES